MLQKQENLFKKTKKSDLFQNVLYCSIRNLKDDINISIGNIQNLHEFCAYGYQLQSIKKSKKRISMLKNCLDRINSIYNHFTFIKEEIINILDLYNGFNIIELYEADTNSYVIRENPKINNNTRKKICKK